MFAAFNIAVKMRSDAILKTDSENEFWLPLQ